MSQQNNTNAMTQDASAEVWLFQRASQGNVTKFRGRFWGVSEAKTFCILSPVSRGLNHPSARDAVGTFGVFTVIKKNR